MESASAAATARVADLIAVKRVAAMCQPEPQVEICATGECFVERAELCEQLPAQYHARQRDQVPRQQRARELRLCDARPAVLERHARKCLQRGHCGRRPHDGPVRVDAIEIGEREASLTVAVERLY